MNNSFITDKINIIFAKSQEFLRPMVSASLFLQRFDYFILMLTILLLGVSLFAENQATGAIAILIIVFTILKLFFIRGQTIRISPSNLVLLIYLAVCFISVFFSSYVALSFKGFSYLLLYIGFYFSILHFFRFNKNKIMPLFFVIMFLVSFETVVALIQSIGPSDIVTTWQDTSYTNAEDLISRVYGTLKPYNPNLLCGYLLVGLSSISATAFWSFLNKHKKTFIFSIIMLILTLCAIFLTGTRSGYVGIFAIFVMLFFLINSLSKNYLTQKAKTAVKTVYFGALTLAGLAIALCPAILKRIFSIFIMRKDSSTSFRINVYQACWKMFTDNWFSGIGCGHDTFQSVYALYMTSNYTALSAYSIYLEVAVESGIFALIAIISFFVMLIKSAIRFLKAENPVMQKAVIISILIMLTGVFTQGFFETVFFRPQLQFLFWTNIAVMSVIIEDTEEITETDIINIKNKIRLVITKIKNFVTEKYLALKEIKWEKWKK